MLTQDNEEVGLYFVIPAKYKSKDDCQPVMLETYQKSIDHGLDPQWLVESKCLTLRPDKRNIFVFEDFSGEAFEHLKQFKCVSLVGPMCLLTIYEDQSQLPHLSRPFFTMAMHNLIIAASGFGAERKEELKKKIELMAGLYCPQLKAATTHLIVKSVQSEKYAKAVSASVTVMTEEWLDAVYSASLKVPVKATDAQFLKYKCPPFMGLLISTSRLSSSDKRRVVDMIQSNGGKHVGSFTCNVNLLIIGKSGDGDKFKYAKTWSIPCLKPSWIYDSVKNGRALPLEGYEVESRSTSTPEKEGKILSNFDMSVMSNIGLGDKTHIDETGINSMLSDVSTISYFKTPQQPLKPPSGSSGVFLKPPVPPAPCSPKRTAFVNEASTSRNVTPTKKQSPAQFKYLLDELDLQKTKQAGPFLDGCKVFLYGFNAEHEEKLRRVLKGSGASRFTELSESITHVLLGKDCDPAFSKQLKGLSYRPHIVTLQWLLQSVSLRRPASEEQYSCGGAETADAAPDTPSPLSKKGLALLQRGDESPVGAQRRSEDRPGSANLSSSKSSRFLKELREPDKNKETDLTAFYRKETTLELPPPPAQPVFHSGIIDADVSKEESAVCTQSDQPLFTGLKFSLVGLSEEACDELSKLLIEHGGKVLSRSFKGIPDYAIVPVVGAAVSTAAEIVTAFWVEECIYLNEVLPVEYFHQPISTLKGKRPLKGCIVGLSGYARKERAFLMEMTVLLGGLAQEVFARKDNPEKNARASTHLICKTAEGSKFSAAKKWKLPAITHLWLLECCKTGKRVPVQPYLLEPDQEIVNTVPDVDEDSVREFSESNESKRESESDQSSCRNEEIGKENAVDERTPIRPLALQRIAGEKAPFSPYHIETPPPHFGISENPSPGERKRLMKWVTSIPEYPQSPEPPKRRLSTPMSELKRQVWAKFGVPTPKAPDVEKSSTKRPNDESKESLSAKRAKLEEKGADEPGGQDAAEEANPVNINRNLFAENFSRAEGQLEEVNKLLQMPIATPGIGGNSFGSGVLGTTTSPRKEKSAAAPKAKKEVSQPYCINWEDPVTVAEKNAPREDDQGDSSERSSKRKSSEEEDDDSSNTATTSESNKRALLESKSAESGDETAPLEEEQNPKNYVFMMSNLDNRERYEKMVTALGGTVAHGTFFQPEATHLVIDRLKRSEKLLASIASGKWILHPTFIEDSFKEGKFLEEKNYEWGGPHNSKITASLVPGSNGSLLAAAATRWRTKVSQKGCGAFDGVRAVIMAGSSKISSFKALVEAGGGTVLKRKDVETATHFFVDDKTSTKGLVIDHAVPVLPLMYLSDFLVNVPQPKIEECAFKGVSLYK